MRDVPLVQIAYLLNYAQMEKAPIAIIEDPFELRLERLKYEYFDRMTQDFLATFGLSEAGRI